MLFNKQEFIEYCVDACKQGTFVTAKHDPSGFAVPFKVDRSVNLWGNEEMEKFLLTDDFKVLAYSDKNSKHSPELYVLTPTNPSVVAGSGVPALSTTPTSSCDIFAVPSGYKQGWHGFAFESAELTAKEESGELSFMFELT